MAERFIPVVRDDRRPVNFWTSCAWSSTGRHDFREGTSHYELIRLGGPYRYCSKCGVSIATAVMPKRTVTNGHVPRSEAARNRLRTCFARDTGGREECYYCGKAVFVATAVLDHFIPRSRGGPDGLDNRRASCAGCDQSKGSRMPWEFMPERFPAPTE